MSSITDRHDVSGAIPHINYSMVKGDRFNCNMYVDLDCPPLIGDWTTELYIDENATSFPHGAWLEEGEMYIDYLATPDYGYL